MNSVQLTENKARAEPWLLVPYRDYWDKRLNQATSIVLTFQSQWDF